MRAAAAIVIVCSMLAACGGERDSTEEVSKAPLVTLAAASHTTARVREIASGPLLSGSIVPRRQAVLRAQVTGSVLEAHALPGEKVEAGSLLVELASDDLEQAVRSARVALREARTNLALAQLQQQRQQMLFEAGAVARRELEAAQQSLNNARSTLAEARATVARVSKQLDATEVHAPFTGWVSAKEVSQGDVVQAGAPLYTLIDLDTNELVAYLPAEEAPRVRIGTPIEVRVSGREEPLEARVSRINPSTDPTTRQVPIYASFGTAGQTLTAGLFAEGRAIIERKRALAVPLNALENTLAASSVAVVRNGRVRHVDVKTGLVDREAERVEILAGLQPGDRVLLGAARTLAAGTRVQLNGADTAVVLRDVRE